MGANKSEALWMYLLQTLPPCGPLLEINTHRNPLPGRVSAGPTDLGLIRVCFVCFTDVLSQTAPGLFRNIVKTREVGGEKDSLRL